MKAKIYKLPLALFIVLITTIMSDSCEPKQSENEDFYVFDVSEETDWDYWAVAKDGSSFFVQVVNSKPSVIYFKPLIDADGYLIFLEENGIPSKAVLENHISLFGNYRKNLMDISVILPDNSIKVFRDIPVAFDFTTLANKGVQGTGIDIIRWTGHAASSAACGMAAGTALGTGGIMIPVAIIGCTAMVVELIAEYKPKDFTVLGFTSEQVSTALTYIACLHAEPSCIYGIASAGIGYLASTLQKIEDKDLDMEMALSLLKSGLWVTTDSAMILSSTSATVGGKVVSDDRSPITETGVYWGLSDNPVITGTKLNIGSGTGIFSTTLSGLNPNYDYFVQAYAINRQGETRGTQVCFNTSDYLPIEYGTYSWSSSGSHTATSCVGAWSWLVTGLYDVSPGMTLESIENNQCTALQTACGKYGLCTGQCKLTVQDNRHFTVSGSWTSTCNSDSKVMYEQVTNTYTLIP
jgi:hypothetical protein